MSTPSMPTHDVENQPPEFAGRDLWADDAALREAVAREGASDFGPHLQAYGALAGLELPVVPVRHEYFITVPVDGLRPDLPTFRVPDATLYGRPDVNALLLGGWEPEAMSCDPHAYGLAEEPPAIEPDWPVLADFAELLAPLYPPVAAAGIRHVDSPERR